MSEDAEFDEVPRQGGWLVWGGWFLALGWLGCAAGLAFVELGQEGLRALPPARLGVGVALAMLPAVMVLIAAYTARQNARMAAANALVLKAAQRLLKPAGEAAGEARAIADAARGDATRLLQVIQETNRQAASLRAGLNEEVKALNGATERARSSSEELVERMAREREAMTELAGALESQTRAFTDIIPDMARQMRESAAQAGKDIAASDAALTTRMAAFDASARAMIEQAARLDAIAGDTLMHADRLASSLSGIEQQMNASRRTVDTAVRAGELAATAATATGEALRDAVGKALDGTRQAAESIRLQANLALREAETAIARLQEAAAQAEATSQAASAAARAQAMDTERHITRVTEALFQASSRAESFAAAQASIAEQALSHVFSGQMPSGAPGPVERNLAGQPQPSKQVLPDPAPATLEQPVQSTLPQIVRPRQASPGAPPDVGDDFFDAISDQGVASQIADGPFTGGPFAGDPNDRDGEPDWASGRGRSADTGFPDIFSDDNANPAGPSLTWQQLLASIEDDPGDDSGQTRALVQRLERAGVRLTDVLDVRDIQRIVQANRRGERDRRRAVRDAAGRTVDQAAKALARDEALQRDASAFLNRDDARSLQQLDEAGRRREGADARLAAFLVLDAALG